MQETGITNTGFYIESSNAFIVIIYTSTLQLKSINVSNPIITRKKPNQTNKQKRYTILEIKQQTYE